MYAEVQAPFDVRFELITPERAQEILENNIDNNRSVTRNRVSRYEEDIRNGLWMATHQGIAIDVKGRLLDGQHRLHAVMQSGVPITAMVCTGLPEEVFPMMDAGMARTAASFLEGSYATQRAALARALITLEDRGGYLSANSGGDRRGAVPSHRILNYLENHPEVMHYGNLYSSAASRAVAKGRFAASTKLALLFAGYISNRAEDWWNDVESLARGDGLPDGNPVKALYRSAPANGNVTDLAMFRATWAAIKYRNHEEVRIIRPDTSKKIKVW